MTNSANHLRLENVSCERQGRLLFENLNIDAYCGQILHIVGKNGSGKSSLLKIMIGLLKPATGHLSWNGQDINFNRSEFTKDLSYIGHKAAIKPELTVLENLRILLGLSDQSVDLSALHETLEQLELNRYRDIQAGYLSQGQQRRIALCRLWLEQTKFWVLDEPYTALDKEAINLLDHVINSAVGNGALVVFTSHQRPTGLSGEIINIHLGN